MPSRILTSGFFKSLQSLEKVNLSTTIDCVQILFLSSTLVTEYISRVCTEHELTIQHPTPKTDVCSRFREANSSEIQ